LSGCEIHKKEGQSTDLSDTERYLSSKREDLGMIKSELVFKYFRKKEQQLYDISDRIGCMSQGNIDYVLKHNKVPKEKLEILYNWKKLSNLPLIDKEEIKKSYGLEGKFVAFFGGNIGYAQELEFLIELAECYKTRDDIVFLIVGKGVMKPKIENLVKEKQLQNVRFIDYLLRDEYEKLLRAADVGLINLSRKFTIPNIPSKAVSYMEAGIPILAATDKNTDFGKMIEDIGAGLWCETGDIQKYKENLEKLLTDTALRERIRERSTAFMKDNMTVACASQRILSRDTK
jgi:glycosyltransferase involved in cell wall biosynthesis